MLSSSLICHTLAISRQNFYWHWKAKGVGVQRSRETDLREVDRAEYGLYYYPLGFVREVAQHVRNEAARDFERVCELLERAGGSKQLEGCFRRPREFEVFLWRLWHRKETPAVFVRLLNDAFSHRRLRKKSLADLLDVLADRLKLCAFHEVLEC